MNRRVMTVVLIVLIVAVTAGAMAQAKKSDQAKCPVCGLSVDTAKAKAQSLFTTYKGQVYYFESKTDFDAFQKNPQNYVK